MRPLSPTFAAFLSLLTGLFVFSAAPLAAQDPSRFSQMLTAAEKAECAMAKLSSDEVAVIDALVRRDTATRGGATPPADTPATFSQRLNESERKAAGIAAMSAAEVAKLDELVDRHQSAQLARTLLAAPSFYVPSSRRLRPEDTKKEKGREIHGTFSLSMGWGSGGYSEKTGAMTMTLEDPDKGYSVTIGYSESRIKGGPMIYRDPSYDPLYRPIDDPLHDPLRP